MQLIPPFGCQEGAAPTSHGKSHHSKTAPHLMRIRWTPAAADDFQNIANYLFEKTPNSAAQLIREIYAAAPSLTRFPNSGRAGKKQVRENG
jgi:hypothetical protein